MSGRRAGDREVIPLFPLSTVLVPGLLLPLNVFEPRYRQLVDELMDKEPDEQFFGVVAIREGREVGVGGAAALFEVGTTAVLRQIRREVDGRAELLTSGDRRFRVLALLPDAPYPRAEVEWLGEDDGEDADVTALTVRARFDEYRATLAAVGAVEAAQMSTMPDDARTLSYLVGAAVVADLRDRQTLLEQPDTGSRLREELRLLHREISLLKVLPSLPAVTLAATTSSPN